MIKWSCSRGHPMDQASGGPLIQLRPGPSLTHLQTTVLDLTTTLAQLLSTLLTIYTGVYTVQGRIKLGPTF